MTSDKERREVAKRLRIEADYYRDFRKYDDTLCMSDSDFTESILEAFGFDDTAVPVYELFDKLADLVDRPTCRDLVEHKADPSVTGKQVADGFFYCSNCGWDGRLWEYVGFGDMTACEALYCPKCGKEIGR